MFQTFGKFRGAKTTSADHTFYDVAEMAEQTAGRAGVMAVICAGLFAAYLYCAHGTFAVLKNVQGLYQAGFKSGSGVALFGQNLSHVLGICALQSALKFGLLLCSVGLLIGAAALYGFGTIIEFLSAGLGFIALVIILTVYGMSAAVVPHVGQTRGPLLWRAIGFFHVT